MTPDLLALYHQQGATYFRDARGLRWVDVAGADAKTWREWLPDLTDDATGGVLLGMLPAFLTIERIHGIVSVVVHVGRHVYAARPTLTEACARALVALGRCA